MKKTSLMEMIREIIQEELMESKAGDEAKRQGLEYMSFGRYGKDGKITHKSQGGKLVPITKTQMAKDTGMTFGRGKKADTMYGTKGRNAFRPTAKFDKETGKLASLTKRSPDDQRNMQQGMSAYGKNRDTLLAKQQDMQSEPNRKQAVMASRLEDKLYNATQQGNIEYNQTYGKEQFMQLTGLKPAEFNYLKKYNEKYAGYDSTFSYHEDSDEVFVHDPMDI